jgi:hypothetical protein
MPKLANKNRTLVLSDLVTTPPEQLHKELDRLIETAKLTKKKPGPKSLEKDIHAALDRAKVSDLPRPLTLEALMGTVDAHYLDQEKDSPDRDTIRKHVKSWLKGARKIEEVPDYYWRRQALETPARHEEVKRRIRTWTKNELPKLARRYEAARKKALREKKDTNTIDADFCREYRAAMEKACEPLVGPLGIPLEQFRDHIRSLPETPVQSYLRQLPPDKFWPLLQRVARAPRKTPRRTLK